MARRSSASQRVARRAVETAIGLYLYVRYVLNLRCWTEGPEQMLEWHVRIVTPAARDGLLFEECRLIHGDAGFRLGAPDRLASGVWRTRWY